MNTMRDFMISKVRVKVLELYFANAEEMYYVREITREIKEEINAVRRELERLFSVGILKSEQRGNRLYYFLNKKYTYFQELQQMVAKTVGLGFAIRKNKRKLGLIAFVMFSGRFVKKLPPQQSQLDVLVIGDVVLPELSALIKKTEEKLQREINYTVFSEEEFEFRKTRRDPFIMEILYGSRVMIIGSEVDFIDRKTPGL